MCPTEGSLTEGELRDACLHAIGDGTSYRCTGVLSNDSLITQGVALAWRSAIEADVARDAARSSDIDLLVGAKGIPAAREDLDDARRAVHEASRRKNSTYWMLSSEMLSLAKDIGTANGNLAVAELNLSRYTAESLAAESDLAAAQAVIDTGSLSRVLPDTYVQALRPDKQPIPDLQVHAGIQGVRKFGVYHRYEKSDGVEILKTFGKPGEWTVDVHWNYMPDGPDSVLATLSITAATFGLIPTDAAGNALPGYKSFAVDGNHHHNNANNIVYVPERMRVGKTCVGGKVLSEEVLEMSAAYRLIFQHLHGGVEAPKKAYGSEQDRVTKLRNFAKKHSTSIDLTYVATDGSLVGTHHFSDGTAGWLQADVQKIREAVQHAEMRLSLAVEAAHTATQRQIAAQRVVMSARAQWDALVVRFRQQFPEKAAIVDRYPDDPRAALDALLDGYDPITLQDAVQNERLAQNILADAVRRNAELADLILFIYPDEREPNQAAAQLAIESLLSEELIVKGKKGQGWQLTPAGVQAAASVRGRFTKINLTAAWFHAAVGQSWVSTLRMHLGKKFQRSAQFGEIDDLINNFVVKKIGNDGFRKRIAECRPPSMTDIKEWCSRASLSQFRDEGRDAQTRQFKGARTERDLRDVNGEVNIPGPADTSKAITLCEDEDGGMMIGSGSGGALVDVVCGDLEQEMLDALSYQEGMTALEDILTAGTEDRTLRMLRACAVGGQTYGQIAIQEQIPRSRVSSLLRAKVQGINAGRILQYLHDEPFSTYEDLAEDLDVTEDALDRLTDANCVEKNEDGCYIITSRGKATLDHLTP